MGNLLFGIVVWFIGIVSDRLFNVACESYNKRWQEKKRAKKNQKLLEILSEIDYTQSNDGHILLEHGAPYYYPESLSSKIVNKDFFCPIPQKYKFELSELGFYQVDSEDFKYLDNKNCMDNSFWGIEEFNTGLSVIGNYCWDRKTKDVISIISEEVAKLFISDLRKGRVRFNGVLFGVASFVPNRKSGVEYPTAFLEYYKTDYFTFQVFSHFYQQNPLHYEKISNEIVNKLSYPFLCSFGVDVLAVISTNHCEAKLEGSDILVIAKRSQNVMVHKGCLHFTMNEALSVRDINVDMPSFDICATRGFYEELKWSRKVRGIKFGDFRFMDFTLNKNGEMAIFGYVKISLNNTVTIEETTESLTRLYKESQDGLLETEGLEFVSLKDARSYLQSKKNIMSVGLSEGLDCFLRRYELSLI